MDNKITIVTAFFPLKRESWKGFERPNNKYLEYFEFWARIKNDMIIYTDEETSKYIEEIRKEKYDRHNTKIVIISDWKELDKELYESIKIATKNDINKEFHFNPGSPESWNYDYNYVMLLKEWCVKDAVEKGFAKDMIAWIDFGFNHGGEYYLKSEEFDFEWKWNFSNKIQLFQINELDNLPIFEIVRRMNTYIQGDIIIAPDNLWLELWKLVKNNMIALNKVGLVDDDQTILLMAYRENKEIFELHKSEWFSEIADCSQNKFTIKPKEEKNLKLLRNLKKTIKNRIKMKRYTNRWYNLLKNEETKG